MHVSQQMLHFCCTELETWVKGVGSVLLPALPSQASHFTEFVSAFIQEKMKEKYLSSANYGMVRRITLPKDGHVLMDRGLELVDVALQGLGNFGDGIKVDYQLPLKWAIILDNLSGSNVITRVLNSGRERQKERDETSEARHGEMQCPWL